MYSHLTPGEPRSPHQGIKGPDTPYTYSLSEPTSPLSFSLPDHHPLPGPRALQTHPDLWDLTLAVPSHNVLLSFIQTSPQMPLERRKLPWSSHLKETYTWLFFPFPALIFS